MRSRPRSGSVHDILDRFKRLAGDPGRDLHASRITAKIAGLVLQDKYQGGRG